MNIWYISKYASPQKYFFGTRHFYLSEEWVKKGDEVCVFTSNSNHLSKNQLPQFKGKSFVENINGVKTIWLNTYKNKTSSGLKRLISWFHFEWQLLSLSKKKFKKPDVIIVSSLSLLTVLNGWRFSKKYKAKFIFEVRDIWPLSAIELGGFSKYHPLILFLAAIEKFGYKKADAIIGTMPNLQEHVFEIIGSNAKCFCIPQGLSIGFYRNQKKLSDDYLKKYIPSNKFIIAYAGTINVNNPLDTFFEAAKLLRENNEIHFLVLGSGSMKDKWIEFAKSFQNVSFPPPVQKAEVNNFLSTVDICYDSIDSTIGRYGLSRNKWIDYMYAEKPVICSFSGFQSMINEANSGTFVEYGNAKKLVDAILDYAKLDEEKITEIGKRGKKFLLENRTFDKLAEEYKNIFKRI